MENIINLQAVDFKDKEFKQSASVISNCWNECEKHLHKAKVSDSEELQSTIKELKSMVSEVCQFLEYLEANR